MKTLINIIDRIHQCTNNHQVYDLVKLSERQLSQVELKVVRSHAAKQREG